MNPTTVGVDLAKNVFELAVSNDEWAIAERHRLTRARFARFFANRPRSRIVMEACASSHHWARTFLAQGHEPLLLPAQYVRAYVKRNKTDAADAAALIEAARCAEIHPVPVKSVEQQMIQQLHRLRSQWMGTRTARINLLRSTLREFGRVIPLGAARALRTVRSALATPDTGLPELLHAPLAEILTEVRELEQRVALLERQLRDLTREDPIVQQLLDIPGIGLLSATALRAAIVDIQRFPSGRHLASWLGLTARESSSAERRRLGRISKRGDTYRAPSSSTAHAPCSMLLRPPPNAAAHSIACAPGHSRPGNVAATTRPPSRSPINSRASSGRPGDISARSTAIGNARRSPTEFHPTRTLLRSDRSHDKRIGRWRGKVVNNAGPLEAPLNDWLRAGDSHDVQST